MPGRSIQCRACLVALIVVLVESVSSAPKNKAPSVQMTGPANGAVFLAPATVSLTANASDRDGSVVKVDFLSGSTLLGTDTSAPYTFSWTNVAAGSYSLKAAATDNDGATQTSGAINIVVQGSNSPPTVSITSPSSGSSFSEPVQITITASASDPGGSVAQVEFFQGSSLLGTDFSAPYSFQWNNVGMGNYLLTARATDNLGTTTTSSTVEVSVEAAPPDPRSLTGEWSPVLSWSDQVGIHMNVLPTGKILSWQDDDDENYYVNGRRGPNKSVAQIWDPATGRFAKIPNPYTNLFCSGHAFLPDGRLLIAGGHEEYNGDGSVDTNIFDPYLGREGDWIPGPPMAAGRWYATACTLPNGEVIAVDGLGHVGNPDVPEVWNGSSWRQLPGAEIALPYYYPFLHLAPDGRVFISGPMGVSYFMDTSGDGSIAEGPITNFGTARLEGTGVMYDDGKVLIMGGSDPPTATAEVIDLRSSNVAWRSVDSMANARRHFDATILPDGKVLVTGGTSSAGYNNAAGAVFAAELWDPGTEKWSTLASMQVRRLYHSSTLLLPDGRVLTAGGGRPAAQGEDPLSEHQDAQIFSPPYLFKGARPMITLAPDILSYGQSFFVQTPDSVNITAVNWIRLSAVTHGLNMNQRINRLSFSMTPGGLNVSAPADSRLCPPGHYILFILDGKGVPSVGHILRIGN